MCRKRHIPNIVYPALHIVYKPQTQNVYNYDYIFTSIYDVRLTNINSINNIAYRL